ncbi:MAG: RluA family pseudouridine synthase [Deltaproteobacteria bacterium]|nr:RluA family pseudouridine synthase [Deltaproteobacteria bacterium]
MTIDEDRIEVSLFVDQLDHSKRIDSFMASRMKRISRGRITSMIENGNVFINSRKVIKNSTRVSYKDKISFYKSLPEEDDSPVNVEILHHNADILIVGKGGDLTIHPTANAYKRTLTTWLKNNHLGEYTPGHRLDRETSGIVICAKKGQPSSVLKGLFFRREIKKAYVALVKGTARNHFTVSDPLDFDTSSPIHIKMGVSEGGAPSETEFFSLGYGNNHSLLLCMPHTGRQHQIRAHLESQGVPIAGDKIYGQHPDIFLEFIETGMTEDLRKNLIFNRQMLHAIAVQLPWDEKIQTFYMSPPNDFLEGCSMIGIDADEILRNMNSAIDEFFSGIEVQMR